MRKSKTIYIENMPRRGNDFVRESRRNNILQYIVYIELSIMRQKIQSLRGCVRFIHNPVNCIKFGVDTTYEICRGFVLRDWYP